MTRHEVLLPGATLGVLGGGQLGRMFALEARRMGYRIGVLDPDADAPATQVADFATIAAYDDLEAVRRFCERVDVLTFEFENVPASTVDAANTIVPVRPGDQLLAAAQHRLTEKRRAQDFGLDVPRFAAITSPSDIRLALTQTALPAVLKTTRMGYDGKGQAIVHTHEQAAEAFERFGGQELIAEQLVEFECEVSVVGARGLDGEIAVYEPFENAHADHILDVTSVPAGIEADVGNRAQNALRAILEGFDVVGVVCVELFVTDRGRVLFNEIAPRPHNSAHLTLDAHACSQFEQQVRAVCGLPLGSTDRNVPAAAMANLLGDLWGEDGLGAPNWLEALNAVPRAHLHLYGKNEPRPGRKMGHVTVCSGNPEWAAGSVRMFRDRLRT